MVPPYDILCGDALDVLPRIADGSIHCVVTSPPYFGLRNYDSPPRVWGGVADCEHAWGDVGRPHHPGQVEQTKWKDAEGAGKGQTAGSGQFCSKCGAWLGAFGLEPTPEMYVEHAVAIFREVRRVLRDDGSLFVNIGDSYAGGGCGGGGGVGRKGLNESVDKNRQASWKVGGRTPNGLKPLDLIGVPWMLTFALRNDGWYLRSDNLWEKLNPMPESVKGTRWERCRVKVDGKSREDGKDYRQGLAEDGYRTDVTNNPVAKWVPCPGCDKCSQNPLNCPDCDGLGVDRAAHDLRLAENASCTNEEHRAWCLANPCKLCKGSGKYGGLVLRRGSWRPTRAHEYVFQFTKTADYYADGEAVKEEAVMRPQRRRSSHKRRDVGDVLPEQTYSTVETREDPARDGEYRNKRSVWSFASQPFNGKKYGSTDHFAVYPPTLPEICILCSTSEYGCCATCGAPYARVLERTAMVVRPSERRVEAHAAGAGSGRTVISDTMVEPAKSETIGWRKTCTCPGRRVVPATVLDPFNGSGTSGLVATKLGRRYLGIDVNPDYCDLSVKRIAAERIQ